MSQSILDLGTASSASRAQALRHHRKRAHQEQRRTAQQLRSQQQAPPPPRPDPTIIPLNQPQPPVMIYNPPQFTVNGRMNQITDQYGRNSNYAKGSEKYKSWDRDMPTNRPTFDVWNLQQKGTGCHRIREHQYFLQQSQQECESRKLENIFLDEADDIMDQEESDGQPFHPKLDAQMIKIFDKFMKEDFRYAWRPRYDNDQRTHSLMATRILHGDEQKIRSLIRLSIIHGSRDYLRRSYEVHDAEGELGLAQEELKLKRQQEQQELERKELNRQVMKGRGPMKKKKKPQQEQERIYGDIEDEDEDEVNAYWQAHAT